VIEVSKKIFIGGTGRSGTSILYRLLSTHKDIYAFSPEMRFIIDYNGLINLVDALSSNYSPVQAREALYEFEVMMSHHFTHKYSSPYIGFAFDEFFSGIYRNRLHEFLDDLTESSFIGRDYTVKGGWFDHHFSFPIRVVEKAYKILSGNHGIPTPFWPKRKLRNVRYYPDREVLCRKAEHFVDDLFSHAANRNQKIHWCEKTPSNLLHLDFLYEVFPDSYFIHIKRDPRGVVQSMANQYWAPNGIEDVCHALKPLYQRWAFLKKKHDFSRFNYLEIKLEDMSADNSRLVEAVTSFLDVEDAFADPPILKESKVNYWKNSMTQEDISRINSILSEEIQEMGYEL
jgi:omega-hydroxy-beta-dihydromenaquinone-9 sulfotransferase